jgi:SAM-dependent methyltransferase
MSEPIDVPHSRENAVRFFKEYISQKKDSLKGKKVYDLSAGSGYIISLFEEAGANVKLFDLFPDKNKFARAKCEKIDLQEKFPITDSSGDIVICSETIEHLPNQFFFFGEVARILKHNGSFILTTPNSSSLRSRFSQFLMESEHYSTPAPNELNAFTPWEGSKDGYFSKLFISGVLRLRTLAAIHKLRIKSIHKTQRSSTSYWLLIFYPLIYFFNKRNFRKQVKADPSNVKTYQEIFDANTSANVLLGKHLILEFEKSFS